MPEVLNATTKAMKAFTTSVSKRPHGLQRLNQPYTPTIPKKSHETLKAGGRLRDVRDVGSPGLKSSGFA